MTRIPPPSELPAVILAGGLGTRLRAATGDTPKAIVPVAGRPFLHHVLERLSRAGIRRAICCTGYGAEAVRQAIGDEFAEIAIGYSHEDRPLGTAGALHQSAEQWHCDYALVMNGDTLFDLDLPAFLEWSGEKKDLRACLALAPFPGVERYGSVTTDDSGRVTKFDEKGHRTSDWINAGIYLIRRALLDSFPPHRPLSLETEIFPALIGGGLYSHRQNGRFLDIGVPEDYAAAQKFVLE
jgi:D-glycero-alpha-D-manno-heptose 1-phosphate guanylyltransferase